MKLAHRIMLAAAFAAPALGAAAQTPAPAPAAEKEDAWSLRIRPEIWIPTLTADTGAGGIPADVDVEFPGALDELEMAAMLNVEVRKGRWGVLVDGLYLRMSGDSPTPGPFFNLIDTTIDAGILDVGIVYRVFERDRGWVDALAGGRYVHIGLDYDLYPDFAAVDEISAATVDRTVNALRDEVGDDVSKQADRLADELAGLADAAGEAARDKVRDEIGARPSPSAKGAVGDRERDLSEALRNAIADAIKERIDGAIQDIQGNAAAIKREIQKAAEAAVSDLKRTASKQVQKQLDEAERKLAAAIEDEMTKAADAHVSETRDWVDPYVGVRGRLKLTDRFFAGGRADIGGFGVGSDLTWQLFGGIGYGLTENIELEVGWRYLAVDYDNDGMVFDATISGVMLGVGFKI